MVSRIPDNSTPRACADPLFSFFLDELVRTLGAQFYRISGVTGPDLVHGDLPVPTISRIYAIYPDLSTVFIVSHITMVPHALL